MLGLRNNDGRVRSQFFVDQRERGKVLCKHRLRLTVALLIIAVEDGHGFRAAAEAASVVAARQHGELLGICIMELHIQDILSCSPSRNKLSCPAACSARACLAENRRAAGATLCDGSAPFARFDGASCAPNLFVLAFAPQADRSSAVCRSCRDCVFPYTLLLTLQVGFSTACLPRRSRPRGHWAGP